MVSKGVLPGTVKDYMSTHVVSLHSGANVHEALEMMVENRVSALPIVDVEDRCVGIITATDLIGVTYDIDDDVVHTDPMDPSSRGRLFEKLANTVGDEPVSSYMSESVASVDESTSLRVAAQIMLREQVHHLPVLNKDEQLIGIISTMDIVAAVADN
jgi:CBS domain-containing protein